MALHTAKKASYLKRLTEPIMCRPFFALQDTSNERLRPFDIGILCFTPQQRHEFVRSNVDIRVRLMIMARLSSLWASPYKR